jgi:hypothetical protein
VHTEAKSKALKLFIILTSFQEQYILRVKWALSIHGVKFINGSACSAFRLGEGELNLLSDDDEWWKCEEVSTFQLYYELKKFRS